ncbi:hypothetical protein ABS872_15295, partial [Photorhabdus laumondii]|uniref:hypothetical protein n=1 Tax=Photorhabdus laumondii TaxID=2218628 RepID=UPI003316319A
IEEAITESFLLRRRFFNDGLSRIRVIYIENKICLKKEALKSLISKKFQECDHAMYTKKRDIFPHN